ncbi:MAG: hypothetical protein RLY80_700 [Actinomycetota bacterium]
MATTSLDAIENILKLKAQVFNDNAAGVTALKNKQIDGLVVDLPTGFYLSAVEVPNGLIVGQIAGSDEADAGFGLLLKKDSPITGCVNGAVKAITECTGTFIISSKVSTCLKARGAWQQAPLLLFQLQPINQVQWKLQDKKLGDERIARIEQ